MRAFATIGRRGLIAGVVGALAFGVVACSDDDEPDDPQPSVNTPDNLEYPITLSGVTLDEQPDSIVSLTPTGTEMLFAVGAGDQVVAVDTLSNYPPEAPVTDLDAFSPNAEAISDYDPDLVVLSYDQDDIVSELDALEIPVYMAGFPTEINDAYLQLVELGTLVGHQQAAEELAADMAAQIGEMTAGLPDRDEPLTAYYELDDNLFSLTSDSLVGQLLTMAGIQSIADGADGDNNTPQLSAEYILDANPDLIFLADTVCCGQSAETLAERDGWDSLDAVANGNVIELNDDVASRWGPRMVDLVGAITQAVQGS